MKVVVGDEGCSFPHRVGSSYLQRASHLWEIVIIQLQQKYLNSDLMSKVRLKWDVVEGLYLRKSSNLRCTLLGVNSLGMVRARELLLMLEEVRRNQKMKKVHANLLRFSFILETSLELGRSSLKDFQQHCDQVWSLEWFETLLNE